MNFIPIHIEVYKTKKNYNKDYCQEIFKSYPDYYNKVGYNPPWIGYFHSIVIMVIILNKQMLSAWGVHFINFGY